MTGPAPFIDVTGFPDDGEIVPPTPRAAQHLIAGGWTRNRVLTTTEEILELNALDVVLYDDTADGGYLQTYVVPDDGTVLWRSPDEFHLSDFAGNYLTATEMPLPLIMLREAS